MVTGMLTLMICFLKNFTIDINSLKKCMKNRIVYLLVAISLFLLCCIIVRCFNNQPFIRGFMGDVIVIALIYAFVKTLFVKTGVLKLCIVVLIFAYATEFMQYYKLVELLGLQQYRIARIVIGTSFDVMDLLAYTLGFMLTLIVENLRSNLKVRTKEA